MGELTPALSSFARIIAERHQYAKDWKARTGGKVFGYLCTYVSEEILHSAGVLPVRILGNGEFPQESSKFVADTWCAFSRDCLAQGLRGHYDYLDGLVYANTCFHMMQAYDAWKRHVPVSFAHLLDLPWDVVSEATAAAFKRELRYFRDYLASFVGHSIEDADIERSIEVLNENRRLLRELYDLRKSPAPPISGAEVLLVMLANQMMDKAEHSVLLRQLLAELRDRQIKSVGPRLMVVGSEIQDIELMEMIESLGSQVVVDEHCIGTRYFWNQVPEGDDLLRRIASRYLQRPPCPLKDCRLPRRRVEHILALANDFSVDGVVFLIQKFCDPHGFDTPYLQKVLEKNGIPSIALEITIPNTIGAMRTRLEAFYEILAKEIV